MPATIIDGKRIAEKIKQIARMTVNTLHGEGINPHLAVVLVGDDTASQVYVRQKEKACRDVGLLSRTVRLPADCTQRQLEAVIRSQVNDPEVSGVMVQMPLPKHLDAKRALEIIPAYKDVDGFSHINTGRLWKGEIAKNIACTPAGIMHIFDEIPVDLSGKHVVIVGRSNTVGKPLAALCLKRNATVTLCHSKTQNLPAVTSQADVLIVAVGRPKLITADMVKPGAVIIDVGINRVDGKLCGDVDFDAVKEVASYITPVPGGVGPLTVAQLMLNTANTALSQRDIVRLYQREKEEELWLKSLLQETSTETTTISSASSSDTKPLKTT